MAKNKSLIIAGVPIDNWIKKPSKISLKRIRDVKKYSNKLIAYVDVLAIKDLIDKHRNNDEHIAIDKIETMRKIVETSTSTIKKQTENIDYLQVSDSFVFVCDPKSIIMLIELLSTIQMRIISECNLLLRGAITIGDAIVRDLERPSAKKMQ